MIMTIFKQTLLNIIMINIIRRRPMRIITVLILIAMCIIMIR